jgi:hypothetical protein
MSSTVKYETIEANPEYGPRDYSRGGAPFLGKRNQTNLQLAFGTSPILSGDYTAEQAAVILGTYNGENVQQGFGMYRRNFQPDPAAGEIYADPRNKATTPTGAGGLPATPYSPNTASPGEGNGVNPTLVSAVAPGLVPNGARPQEQLNPANGEFLNRDMNGKVDNIGKVRKFKLGVGSATARAVSNP